MGDAGSLFVGFTLACLAVQGSWRSPTVPTSVIIPCLVLAYPLFDTTLVVILRLRRGQSPFVEGETTRHIGWYDWAWDAWRRCS